MQEKLENLTSYLETPHFPTNNFCSSKSLFAIPSPCKFAIAGFAEILCFAFAHRKAGFMLFQMIFRMWNITLLMTWMSTKYDKGSFTNYVDKILDFFDHLPPCVFISYYMNVDKKQTF